MLSREEATKEFIEELRRQGVPEDDIEIHLAQLNALYNVMGEAEEEYAIQIAEESVEHLIGRLHLLKAVVGHQCENCIFETNKDLNTIHDMVTEMIRRSDAG